ncbi:MAG: NAD-dependent deacetylase [Spirochaetaceae bacterium]|jgi:NAD-dependent deacetylase|nr:NAD-dependent deacetylase [Spirochaetaceae bacterium]
MYTPADISIEEQIDSLFDLIRQSRHCVALTGAGVSTLSGIRDFRGKNGLYKERDAEKIFDIDYFVKDPSLYYNAARSFIYNLNEREASVVHTCLGALENRGFLKAIITQNIDLLHQKGGSRRVIEIHGSPSIHYCRSCSDLPKVEALAAAKQKAPLSGKDLLGFDEAAALVKTGKLPRCGRCGAVLKPAITFFGEALPARALDDAEGEAKKADLMLILGTSLTVFPAAGIPEISIQSGGRIVIINDMATPLDRYAVLRFEDLGTVFEGIRARLDRL